MDHTDQNPEIKSPTSPFKEGVLGPELGIPQGRPITVRIVAAEAEAECHYWVGLFKTGTLDPSTVMDLESLPEMFTKAAQEGLGNEGPLLLTDSLSQPPKYLYLLPVPGHEFRDRAIWVGDLSNTLQSMNPKSVGFYLAPDLLDQEHSDELIQHMLRDLITNTSINDFYLLVGSHGLNAVLNSATKLKLEFDQDKINLFVFH